LGVAARADGFVYWTEVGIDGRIGRADLDGTNANHAFITGASEPCGVAVNSAHVFWANGSTGTIGRANLNGTGVDQSFITGADSPCGVAVDPTHIFWANGGGTTIGRANLDGTSASQSFISGASLPCGVAVNSSHIYWANFVTGAGMNEPGTIGRADLDGEPVDQSLVPNIFDPCGVALNSTHVYWGSAAGKIGRANLDGTQELNFTPGVTSVCGVALNATHLYWASASEARIGRFGLDGSNPQPNFIPVVGLTCGVALDAGATPPSPAQPPSSDITIGKPKLNKKKGTAVLPVTVQAPGTLALGGRNIRPGTAQADAPKTIDLPLRAAGKAKAKLKEDGKAKVSPQVTFTPTGGAPNTEGTKVKLVKR
jgi:hypothetical protein